MREEMTTQEQVNNLRPWYHSIVLPDGTVTPGEPYDEIWGIIEQSMRKQNYNGKSVLDIGSFDGKWAFLAESLGASRVVATDCNWKAYRNFLFVHQQLKSKVLPFYNAPVQKLYERLDCYFHSINVQWEPCNAEKLSEFKQTKDDPRFDIVQFFGVFYHLPDPLQALLQIRSVIKTGGVLLVETPVSDISAPGMEFNAASKRIYYDPTTYFAPSITGLNAMLEMALFEDVQIVAEKHYHYPRTVIKAIARAATPADDELVFNHYRNGGIKL